MSEFIFYVLLLLSLSVNVLMFWYVRKLLQEFKYITDNYDEINDVLLEFSQHIQRIHGLETYYGDETLGGLITHSKEVVEEIQYFIETFSTDEVDDKEEKDEEEEE